MVHVHRWRRSHGKFQVGSGEHQSCCGPSHTRVRFTHSDDADVYAIDVSGTVEGFTLGGHGAYWNINEYPIPTTVTAIGTQAAAQADLYWLGAYADGNYAGFNFNFDFIYDGGKVRPVVGDDIKLGGWIAALKASFPWENFDFGGGAWYATGANATSDKNKAYLQPPGSEPGPNAFNQYGSVFFGPGSWRGEHAYGGQW